MDYEIIASGSEGNTSAPDYEIIAKGESIASPDFKQRNMLSDAAEGLTYAMFGDEQGNRSPRNLGPNIYGGIENAARETAGTALDMVGGMVPGAEGLWDTADKLREPIPENSVGKLFGDAVVGGLAGKTAGSLAELGVKNPIARTANLKNKVIDVNDKMTNSTSAKEILGLSKTKNKIVDSLQNPPRLPIVSAATKIPVVGSAVGKVWDKVIGDIIDVPLSHLSDAAAARRLMRMKTTLSDAGHNSDDIENILSDYFSRNPKAAPKASASAKAANDVPSGGSKPNTPPRSPEPTLAPTKSAFDDLFGIEKKAPKKPTVVNDQPSKTKAGKSENSIFVPGKSERSIGIYAKNKDEIAQLQQSLPGTKGDKRKNIQNKIDALYRESNIADIEDFPSELKKANKINDDAYRDIVKMHNKGNSEATDIVTNKNTLFGKTKDISLDDVDKITKETANNKYPKNYSSPAIDFPKARKVIDIYLKSGGKLSIAGLAVALGTNNEEAKALYDEYNNITQLKDIGL